MEVRQAVTEQVCTYLQQAVVCLVVLAGPSYAQLVQYSFNFLDGPTTRLETLDASGIVRGTFNFLDSQGNLKEQHYDYTVQVGPPAEKFVEPVPAPDGVAPVQPSETAPEHTNVASHTTPELTQEESAPGPEGSEPIQDVPAVTESPEPTTSTPEVTPATPEPTTEQPPTPTTTEPPFDAFKIDFKRFGQRLRALARFTPSPSRATRTRRAVVVPGPYTYAAAPHSLNTFSGPLVYSHPAVAYSSAFPAVTAYSEILAAAPAAPRDAALLRVVHNPAHSVSYRVD